jgi:hypothetical protein
MLNHFAEGRELLILLILGLTLLPASAQHWETELIRNGDFSQGILYWDVSPSSYFSVSPVDIRALLGPFIDGQIKNNAALAFKAEEKPGSYSGTIAQTVFIPPSPKATLKFTVIGPFSCEGFSGLLQDPQMRVSVLLGGNRYDVSGTVSLRGGTRAYDNIDNVGVCICNFSYDLTKYSGQKVTLLISFSFYQGGYYGARIYFDDISIKISGDFSISAPSHLAIQGGGSSSITITVSSIGGFNSPVRLDVSGVPPGVAATIDPRDVTPSMGGSVVSTLRVSVDKMANAGDYTLTITGISDNISRKTSVVLSIVPPPEEKPQKQAPPPQQPPISQAPRMPSSKTPEIQLPSIQIDFLLPLIVMLFVAFPIIVVMRRREGRERKPIKELQNAWIYEEIQKIEDFIKELEDFDKEEHS